MANKALQTFNNLPGWAKGILTIGTLAIATGVGYTIYKNRRDKKLAEEALANTLITKNELDELIKNGILPSYQQSQFILWSDKIQTDFAGCDPGIFSSTTDEKMKTFEIANNPKYYSNSGKTLLAIISQFKNDADFNALILGWNGKEGTREYDQCGIWNGNFKGTLLQAVADELTNREILGLNTILSSKGINYKF